MAGSRVYTTVELVLGEQPAMVFAREVDPSGPWPELVVHPAASAGTGL